ALAGVVRPRAPGLARLVHRLVHQQDLPRQARRRRRVLHVVEDLVVLALVDGLGAVAVREVVLVLELHQRVVAGARDRGLRPVHAEGVAAVAQQVVPYRLVAVLRDRERDAAHATHDAVAAGGELRLRGALLRLLVVAGGERGAAARGI